MCQFWHVSILEQTEDLLFWFFDLRRPVVVCMCECVYVCVCMCVCMCVVVCMCECVHV